MKTLIDTLLEMFSYTFLVRAVVVGALVSLCAALLGVSLVLKRYSMIGDGLSHVGFGSLAVATAMNTAPLAVSIPVVVAAAFLLLRLSENSKIKGDAAIAILSTASLAIGVVVISLTTGMNTDVCNYLFGSILAMSKGDVTLSIALAAVVLALFALCYNKIFAVTFDEGFAKATGACTGLYNMLIALLAALTIVLGMRMMGALLISSLVIFPALTAMRVCKRFKSVTICAAAVSTVCFFVGVAISYLYATPTGASVVLVNVLAFLAFWAAQKLAALRRRGGRFRAAGGMLTLCLCLLPPLIIASMVGCQGGGANAASAAEVAVPATTAVSAITTTASTASLETTPQKGDDDDVDEAAAGLDEAAAAATEASSDEATEIIDIKEKMFVAQTNEIYLNADDYFGKTLRYEGIFDVWEDIATEESHYFVIRYGPGCCGYDANAGFEVRRAEGVAGAAEGYPAQDDWVEATGVLGYYTEEGHNYLRLELSSLVVLDVRGAEYVYQ